MLGVASFEVATVFSKLTFFVINELAFTSNFKEVIPATLMSARFQSYHAVDARVRYFNEFIYIWISCEHIAVWCSRFLPGLNAWKEIFKSSSSQIGHYCLRVAFAQVVSHTLYSHPHNLDPCITVYMSIRMVHYCRVLWR